MLLLNEGLNDILLDVNSRNRTYSKILTLHYIVK